MLAAFAALVVVAFIALGASSTFDGMVDVEMYSGKSSVAPLSKETMLITVHGSPSTFDEAKGKHEKCIDSHVRKRGMPCHGNNVMMYASSVKEGQTYQSCKSAKWRYTGKLLNEKHIDKNKFQNFRGVAFDQGHSAL